VVDLFSLRVVRGKNSFYFGSKKPCNIAKNMIYLKSYRKILWKKKLKKKLKQKPLTQKNHRVHADSVVTDGQGFRFFIEGNIYAGLKVYRLVLFVRDSQVLKLVQSVGGVGDKLPKENLPVGIKRMNDKVQQPAYFGLKLMLCHDGLLIN
jgi:hypothetical protein